MLFCCATLIQGSPVQPETRYADSGGVNIAYQVLGDGPRDLVFVMGWVSNIEVFWEEPTLALRLDLEPSSYSLRLGCSALDHREAEEGERQRAISASQTPSNCVSRRTRQCPVHLDSGRRWATVDCRIFTASR